MIKTVLILLTLASSGCGSGSRQADSDATVEVGDTETSAAGSVSTVDNGVCSTSADNTKCRGNIYIDGQLKTPSSIGLSVGGLCQSGVCCLGCWDGSKCQYFNNKNCSDPSTEPANGLPCSGSCQSGQTCKLGGSSVIPYFFFSCQR